MKPSDASRYDKPKPPVVRTEQVVCSCGHQVEFELFADKVDRFRDGRRKKLTDRPCPTCRKKAHEERMAKDQAAAAERQNAKPATPGKPKEREQRLPDGAAFAVRYDAKAA